jgi:hypothetical protein
LGGHLLTGGRERRNGDEVHVKTGLEKIPLQFMRHEAAVVDSIEVHARHLLHCS